MEDVLGRNLWEMYAGGERHDHTADAPSHPRDHRDSARYWGLKGDRGAGSVATRREEDR